MHVVRRLQKLRGRTTSLLRHKPFRSSRVRRFSLGEIPALLSQAGALGPKLTVVLTALIAQRKAVYKDGGFNATDIPIPFENGHVRKEHGFGLLYPALEEGQTKEGLQAKLLEVFHNIGEDNQGDYAPGGLSSNTHEFFESPQASSNWREVVFGTAWPDDLVNLWPDMTSDRGVGTWCWFGMGGHFIRKPIDDDFTQYGLDLPNGPLKKEDIAYVMPVTEFYSYTVREPYERFGACAFFNSEKELNGIYVKYADTIFTPTDGDAWEHAKYVLKATTMTQATMQDHLGSVHLIVGNTICTAVRQCFPSDHPMRGFLTPHTFHTATANLNIPVLLAYYGFFHLSWSLTFDSVYASIGDYRGKYKFIPIRKYIEAAGMMDESDIEYPFKDSLDLYAVIEEYVTTFVKMYYPTTEALLADESLSDFWREIARGHLLGQEDLTPDALIEVIAHFILNGSGFHQHVGMVLPYLARDDQVGTRISRGQTRQDIQAFAGAGALGTAITGIEPKLKDDYSFCFIEDRNYEEVMNNFKRFQANLLTLEQDIDEKNKKRVMPYNDFNPAVVGCAVSI